LKQAGLKKYQEVWHTVPRYLHIQPCLVLIYADYLIQEKNTHQAEMLLREALKKNWDEYLLLKYCEVKDNSAKQLANAEHWLRTHADDANLLYVLGQLSIANELWGKARSYFEESLAIKPSSRSYQALAALLETIEDTKEAIKYYRQALLYCREEK
ncbi:MAG: heme biosynthesis protein HemY, partial [Gammaproteobacteria bacterium]